MAEVFYESEVMVTKVTIELDDKETEALCFVLRRIVCKTYNECELNTSQSDYIAGIFHELVMSAPDQIF